MEHEFVRHKPRLALRRHPGEAALAGQWPIGEPKPRGENFLPVRENERAPLGRTLAEGGLAEPRLADRTFGKSGLAAQMATELAAEILAEALASVIAQSFAERHLSGCTLAESGPLQAGP